MSINDESSWRHIERSLGLTWRRELEWKLKEAGVAEYLSTTSPMGHQVRDRLDLILRLPNTETALWAARMLQVLDSMPDDYRQALEAHLNDKFYGKEIANFLADTE